MSLQDRLNEAGEFAPGWRPTPGDQVIGHLTEIGQGSDFNQDPYLIYTLRQANGERIAVHAFQTVLKQEFAKYKLKIGDEIGVKYFGVPEGKKYHKFAVVSDAELAPLNAGPTEPNYGGGFQPHGGSDLGGNQAAGFQPQPTPDFRPQPTPVTNANGDPIPF